MACCDGQAAWDTFGNLFLVYINNSVNQINVILSTDGGVTFSAPVTAGTGSVDQPSIAVGNGSVWVDWNSERKHGRAWGASDGSRAFGDRSTRNRRSRQRLAASGVSPSGLARTAARSS